MTENREFYEHYTKGDKKNKFVDGVLKIAVRNLCKLLDNFKKDWQVETHVKSPNLLTLYKVLKEETYKCHENGKHIWNFTIYPIVRIGLFILNCDSYYRKILFAVLDRVQKERPFNPKKP